MNSSILSYKIPFSTEENNNKSNNIPNIPITNITNQNYITTTSKTSHPHFKKNNTMIDRYSNNELAVNRYKKLGSYNMNSYYNEAYEGNEDQVNTSNQMSVNYNYILNSKSNRNNIQSSKLNSNRYYTNNYNAYNNAKYHSLESNRGKRAYSKRSSFSQQSRNNNQINPVFKSNSVRNKYKGNLKMSEFSYNQNYPNKLNDNYFYNNSNKNSNAYIGSFPNSNNTSTYQNQNTKYNQYKINQSSNLNNNITNITTNTNNIETNLNNTVMDNVNNTNNQNNIKSYSPLIQTTINNYDNNNKAVSDIVKAQKQKEMSRMMMLDSNIKKGFNSKLYNIGKKLIQPKTYIFNENISEKYIRNYNTTNNNYTNTNTNNRKDNADAVYNAINNKSRTGSPEYMRYYNNKNSNYSNNSNGNNNKKPINSNILNKDKLSNNTNSNINPVNLKESNSSLKLTLKSGVQVDFPELIENKNDFNNISQKERQNRRLKIELLKSIIKVDVKKEREIKLSKVNKELSKRNNNISVIEENNSNNNNNSISNNIINTNSNINERNDKEIETRLLLKVMKEINIEKSLLNNNSLHPINICYDVVSTTPQLKHLKESGGFLFNINRKQIINFSQDDILNQITSNVNTYKSRTQEELVNRKNINNSQFNNESNNNNKNKVKNTNYEINNNFYGDIKIDNNEEIRNNNNSILQNSLNKKIDPKSLLGENDNSNSNNDEFPEFCFLFSPILFKITIQRRDIDSALAYLIIIPSQLSEKSGMEHYYLIIKDPNFNDVYKLDFLQIIDVRIINNDSFYISFFDDVNKETLIIEVETRNLNLTTKYVAGLVLLANSSKSKIVLASEKKSLQILNSNINVKNGKGVGNMRNIDFTKMKKNKITSVIKKTGGYSLGKNNGKYRWKM